MKRFAVVFVLAGLTAGANAVEDLNSAMRDVRKKCMDFIQEFKATKGGVLPSKRPKNAAEALSSFDSVSGKDSNSIAAMRNSCTAALDDLVVFYDQAVSHARSVGESDAGFADFKAVIDTCKNLSSTDLAKQDKAKTAIAAVKKTNVGNGFGAQGNNAGSLGKGVATMQQNALANRVEESDSYKKEIEILDACGASIKKIPA